MEEILPFPRPEPDGPGPHWRKATRGGSEDGRATARWQPEVCLEVRSVEWQRRMTLRHPDHACILSPDLAFRERPVHHEPAMAVAPVRHADGDLERAARIIESCARLRQLADGVRRVRVGEFDALERIEGRTGGIECGPAPDRHVAPPYDSGGEHALIALPHRRRQRRHHDRRRPGVADHFGVLDPIQEGHGIGPADRLTHFAGFDDVTLEQLSEMNLSLFAPAGAGRRYHGSGSYSCGSERPAKGGEVANHPGWGTAARPGASSRRVHPRHPAQPAADRPHERRARPATRRASGDRGSRRGWCVW